MDRGSLKARQGSKYAAKPSKERRRKGDLNVVCGRQQAWADPLPFTKRPATLTCPDMGPPLYVTIRTNESLTSYGNHKAYTHSKAYTAQL